MPMAKTLLTADQVKEYLNIPDFRSITKDKLIEFVSAIPNMDKDVAIKTIEQFPEFSGYATVLVAHYEKMCDSILRENGSSVQAVMDGYRYTLDTLGKWPQPKTLIRLKSGTLQKKWSKSRTKWLPWIPATKTSSRE